MEKVQIIKEGRRVSLKILWKGGAVVEQRFELPAVPERSVSSIDLVELVRELSTRHTDEQIARILIRKGMKTPTGLTFNAHRVANLRLDNGIACYRQSNDRNKSTCTVDQAAEILDVAPHTIYLWIKAGILKADQVTPGAPWAVYISDEDKRRLTAADAPKGWLPLEPAARECGVSKQTVLNWVKEGKIKFVYVTKGKRRGLRIDVNSAGYKKQRPLLG
jgi:transposase